MSVDHVVFVPSAPLLVPAVAGGSAGLDAQLRATALAALADALTAAPNEVLVLAGGATGGPWDDLATWDFSGFGVERRPPDARPRLPWALGIGAWLLDECGWGGSRRYVGVDDVAGIVQTVDAATRTVVLAVGDGSACRTERAPGHLDGRAEGFDETIAVALGTGDAGGLAGLDPQVGRELLCAGLPVWAAVAGLLGAEQPQSAALLAEEAPYGVGYFVALWSFNGGRSAVSIS